MADPLLQRVRGLLQGVLASYQRILPRFPALLGDGRGHVAVETQPGYVWVRLGAEGKEGVAMAWNQSCPARDGLAVIVGYLPWQPRTFQVICQREVYMGCGEGIIPNIPAHGFTHQWADPRGGDDVVYVQLRQWMPFRVGLYGDSGFTVAVQPGVIWRDGYTYVNFQLLDLTSHQPSGANARYVLIALDADGVAQAHAGSTVSPQQDLSLGDCPAPLVSELPLAAVALYSGQTTIRDSDEQFDIVDLRWPQYASMAWKPAFEELILAIQEIEILLTEVDLLAYRTEKRLMLECMMLDFTLTRHFVGR